MREKVMLSLLPEIHSSHAFLGSGSVVYIEGGRESLCLEFVFTCEEIFLARETNKERMNEGENLIVPVAVSILLFGLCLCV
jgi:hypothetical protein